MISTFELSKILSAEESDGYFRQLTNKLSLFLVDELTELLVIEERVMLCWALDQTLLSEIHNQNNIKE